METMKLAMIVHEAEEGGFWASFPDLPGCFTQGDTLGEIRENAREAVSGHLAVMRDRGEDVPDNVVVVETVEIEAA